MKDEFVNKDFHNFMKVVEFEGEFDDEEDELQKQTEKIPSERELQSKSKHQIEIDQIKYFFHYLAKSN